MNRLSVFFAAAAIVFAGTSFGLWKELGEQRAQIEILTSQGHERQVPQQVAARAAEPLTVATAAAPAGSVQCANAAAMRAMPSAASDVPKSPRRMTAWKERLERLKDPEYRAASIEDMKGNIRQWHKEMATVVGLSREEEDKVLTLLAEHQIREMEVRPSYQAGEEPLSEEEQRQLLDRAKRLQQQNKEEIRDLLGESKFKAFEAYQESLNARSHVNELRESLKDSSDPVRDDQVPHLISALVAVDKEIRREVEAMQAAEQSRTSMRTTTERVKSMEEWMERQARYNRSRVEAVAPYLSTRQLDKFKEPLDRQAERQRIENRLRRAQLAREEQGASSPP